MAGCRKLRGGDKLEILFSSIAPDYRNCPARRIIDCIIVIIA